MFLCIVCINLSPMLALLWNIVLKWDLLKIIIDFPLLTVQHTQFKLFESRWHRHQERDRIWFGDTWNLISLLHYNADLLVVVYTSCDIKFIYISWVDIPWQWDHDASCCAKRWGVRCVHVTRSQQGCRHPSSSTKATCKEGCF